MTFRLSFVLAVAALSLRASLLAAQVEPPLALSTSAVAPTGAGMVTFELVSGPFGIVLSDEGHTLLDATIRITKLPAPESFGDYHHYIAWAATPGFEEIAFLGEVRNDSSPLKARVRWNKFRILISAERAEHPLQPTGPFVLRGASSAFRMVPMMPCHIGVDQGVC